MRRVAREKGRCARRTVASGGVASDRITLGGGSTFYRRGIPFTVHTASHYANHYETAKQKQSVSYRPANRSIMFRIRVEWID